MAAETATARGDHPADALSGRRAIQSVRAGRERAAGFDKQRYKQRNVVERLIGRLKECRRIATRYDKLAVSFRAFVLLGFIKIWTQHLLLDRA